MKNRKSGFTLIELLVVVMIIGILVAIAVPIAFNARKKARIAEAMRAVNDIEVAVKAYYAEYGKLPIPSNMHNQGEPKYFTAEEGGDASKEVIKALAARDDDGDEVRNPKERVFLDVNQVNNMMDEYDEWEGEFLDPWGSQYEIKFDADYSGKCEFYTASGMEEVDSIAVAVSKGPDKLGPWESGQPARLTDEITSYSAPGR